MEWTLDTGRYGAAGVDAKDLRRVLEESMAHHEKTVPEGIEMQVLSRAPQNAGTDPEALKKVQQYAADAKAARAKVEKQMPLIQDQMKAGIKAACDLAAAMSGQVTCTIKGHIARSHASGVHKRISVHIDQAAPILDEIEDD